MLHASGNGKKVRVAIFISNKRDFIQRLTKDKEAHYVMIKRSIQEEDIILISTYEPNIG